MPDRPPVPVAITEASVPIPVTMDPLAEPLEVRVTNQPVPRKHIQHQDTDPSLPAKTTFQEDLTVASQRQVNLIWERTQAAIALMVVLTTMCAGLYASYTKSDAPIPTILSVAFGTVVGFYFSRTNHQAIGGIGPKPNETQPYKGR